MKHKHIKKAVKRAIKSSAWLEGELDYQLSRFGVYSKKDMWKAKCMLIAKLYERIILDGNRE